MLFIFIYENVWVGVILFTRLPFGLPTHPSRPWLLGIWLPNQRSSCPKQRFLVGSWQPSYQVVQHVNQPHGNYKQGKKKKISFLKSTPFQNSKHLLGGCLLQVGFSSLKWFFQLLGASLKVAQLVILLFMLRLESLGLFFQLVSTLSSGLNFSTKGSEFLTRKNKHINTPSFHLFFKQN